MTSFTDAAVAYMLDDLGLQPEPNYDEPEIAWVLPIYENGYLKHPGRAVVYTPSGWRQGEHPDHNTAADHHKLLVADKPTRPFRKARR
jgi:hypothetical protein